MEDGVRTKTVILDFVKAILQDRISLGCEKYYVEPFILDVLFAINMVIARVLVSLICSDNCT